MRLRSLNLIVAALGVWCLAESICAQSAVADEAQVVNLSVEYAAHGSEYGKVTWRAEVQNPTAQEVTVSLVLSLLNAEGEVVMSASMDDVSIAANSATAFTQTDPILQAVWRRVASHSVAIVP